ncbi:hypothetical protein GGI12_005909 [Dipsacomyces acuminosporus]|nr:hypothetical protein GGI12_005909 [Dipsacomyces acuminosporus]
MATGYLFHVNENHFSPGFMSTLETILDRGGILSCIEVQSSDGFGAVYQVRINTREPDGEWYRRCLTEHNYVHWKKEKELLRKGDLFPSIKGTGFKVFNHHKHRSSNVQIKLVNLAFAGCITHMKEAIIEEIEVFETVSKLKQPGIAKYYGCVVENGLITGIAVKKYRKTLARVLRENDTPCSHLSSANLVYAATAMERLGLCISPIKPSSVVLDDRNNMVLADMHCAFPSWWLGGTKRWDPEDCSGPNALQAHKKDESEHCYPLKDLFSKICSRVCIEGYAGEPSRKAKRLSKTTTFSCGRAVCETQNRQEEHLSGGRMNIHKLWRYEGPNALL